MYIHVYIHILKYVACICYVYRYMDISTNMLSEHMFTYIYIYMCIQDISYNYDEHAKVEEAVKWLASPEKQKLLDSEATIWNHGPVSQLPVSQLKGLGLVQG